MRSPLLLVVIASAWAQQVPSVAELLRVSAQKGEANDPKTREYLYREYSVTTELNDKGVETERHTETWEAIGLEGSEYRKLIQRDDQSLSAKEQKKEDERLKKEAAKRREEKKNKRSLNPIKRTYSFGFAKGDERFFNFHVAGEEPIEGRAAYVLEGTPKAGIQPANNHEKQLLVSRVKLWIDKAETFESGIELEIVGEGSDVRPGSALSVTQVRMDDGTWLLHEIRARFVIRPLRIANIREEVRSTRSDYHKFSVDSRVVDAN